MREASEAIGKMVKGKVLIRRRVQRTSGGGRKELRKAIK